tara:strand:- start:874 stop:1089 length:216 start_codon:yes stop_codon:yes gene_type:complete
MDSLDEIKKVLKDEAKKIKEEQDSDVVKRAVANSIKLEKSKLFGITATSKPQIDTLINKSLAEFMEKNNAP